MNDDSKVVHININYFRNSINFEMNANSIFPHKARDASI